MLNYYRIKNPHLNQDTKKSRKDVGKFELKRGQI